MSVRSSAWTVRHKITGRLTSIPPATRRHADPLDPDRRRALLRALLTDRQIDLQRPSCGLLIVVFSQRISRPRAADHRRHPRTRRTGAPRDRSTSRCCSPSRSRTLTRQLRDTPPAPRPRPTTHWLFHGGRDGNHLSEDYMRERLTKLGIKALPARTAATNNSPAAFPQRSSPTSRVRRHHHRTLDQARRR